MDGHPDLCMVMGGPPSWVLLTCATLQWTIWTISKGKMHVYKNTAVMMAGLSGVFAMMLFSLPVRAQKVDSYLNDMNEALAPYGATLTSNSCHSVQIDLSGPWGTAAIPSGVDDKTHELRWMFLKIDAKRILVDLADLDEDKLRNQPIFSVEYLRRHVKGTPYDPDTPIVMLGNKRPKQAYERAHRRP